MLAMNPLLTQLFREALDLAPSARSAYLDAQCSDPALRAQLDALLLAAEQTEPPMQVVALPTQAPGKIEAIDRTGERIGAFRLLKSSGQGGMGAVWLAERVGGFRQQVAIKWLHAGLSASARQRFARERETLAKLEHPGIARIVDGGSDGAADWFAMEFVDGVTLDAYVKSTQANLKQRIELMITLCDAVQFAHQNLIVHRDLKPGNILVNANGQPKLLDFGVAKILDDSNTTESRAPMTFAYAAPEQIRGDAITTATDVYALGVILFELLTGQRPHKAKGDGSLSLLQAITDTDATAPSHVLSSRTNTETTIRPNQLKGDLDTIVLKALSREPARRYASALALGEDLRRFAQHQPIQAQADTVGYRLRKFVQRHQVLVAVSLFAALAILGFGARSMIDANAAVQARDLAQKESARAQAVQDFLTGLFSDQRPDAAQGRAISAKDLLDLAERRLDQPEFITAPEVRAALLDTLAKLRYDLNDFDSALRHNDASITLAEHQFGARSTAYGLAVVERADTLWWLGRIDETLSECRRGLDILRHADRAASNNESEQAHQTSLINCADSARSADNYAQCEAWQDEAEIRLHAASAPSTKVEEYLMRSRGKLANARGDFARVIALNSSLLARLRTRADVAPSEIATLQHGLGIARFRLGDSQGAIADLSIALASHVRTFGPDTVHVASSRRALALALDDAGDIEGAQQNMQQALTAARAHFAPDSADFALTVRDAGLLALRQGQGAAGEALLLEALAANERGYGPNHSVSWQIRFVLWENALVEQRLVDAQRQAQFFLDLPDAKKPSGSLALSMARLHLQQARAENNLQHMAHEQLLLSTLLGSTTFLSDEERAKTLYQLATAARALDQQASSQGWTAELSALHTKMPQATRRRAQVESWLAELQRTPM
jgi:eukaryotic-like serine/threonine-protein kinase